LQAQEAMSHNGYYVKYYIRRSRRPLLRNLTPSPNLRRRLSPRVALPVEFFKALLCHMRVYLRRGDVGVAEHRLDVP